jgi:hypothetical protein
MTGETRTLKVGDPATDFELKGTGGTQFRLRDRRRKKNVVLAFFPAAFSPVCSQQISRRVMRVPAWLAPYTRGTVRMEATSCQRSGVLRR